MLSSIVKITKSDLSNIPPRWLYWKYYTGDLSLSLSLSLSLYIYMCLFVYSYIPCKLSQHSLRLWGMLSDSQLPNSTPKRLLKVWFGSDDLNNNNKFPSHSALKVELYFCVKCYLALLCQGSLHWYLHLSFWRVFWQVFGRGDRSGFSMRLRYSNCVLLFHNFDNQRPNKSVWGNKPFKPAYSICVWIRRVTLKKPLCQNVVEVSAVVGKENANHLCDWWSRYNFTEVQVIVVPWEKFPMTVKLRSLVM